MQESEERCVALELSAIASHKRVARAEGEADLLRQELRGQRLAAAALQDELNDAVVRWEDETVRRMEVRASVAAVT